VTLERRATNSFFFFFFVVVITGVAVCGRADAHAGDSFDRFSAA